ncbi:nitroreductase family protein [Enterococcus sp. DIV0756]|uniref:nitroreductase family protein n=1 Tax=Enterococcus sp. DIV0756 TaxID=2774636 RepID=UPI003F2227EC
MSVKDRIKEILPDFVFDFRKSKRLKKISNYNRRRYNRAMNYRGIEKYQANLLMHSHVLEKGLSHREIRYGFGLNNLVEEAEAMKEYLNFGMKSDFAYQVACSTVKNYIDLHENVKYSTEYLSRIFTKEQLEDINKCNFNNTGYKYIDNMNNFSTFTDFSLNRYSIREFSPNEVNEDDLVHAISTAQKAPSACNRQSSRVYIIKNKEIIKKSLEIQGGYNGYEYPKILLVIVADQVVYSDPGDLNMSYIDGGIFTMDLLLALEEKNIGACTLNTSFEIKRESILRDLIKIKDSEVFISFLPIGKKNKKNKVCESPRYDTKEIIKYIV